MTRAIVLPAMVVTLAGAHGRVYDAADDTSIRSSGAVMRQTFDGAFRARIPGE